ncbi:hypothetical protein [Streptomyces sp. bgisy084]|uniref:hypothetical protein n=1 Tax=Streptomyces sp. bgisy084 TaxID=3413777 RepID=UPI003D728AE9
MTAENPDAGRTSWTIKGNVHASTDYPAEKEIFLRNENSYRSATMRLDAPSAAPTAAAAA